MSRARYFAPPVIWMAVIFTFSTSLFGSAETGSVLLPILRSVFPGASPSSIELMHTAIRKAAHVAEYAVLALLWLRGLERGASWSRGKSAAAALIISAMYACSDEFHQSFNANRTPSAVDVLIDTAGASAALLFMRMKDKGRP